MSRKTFWEILDDYEFDANAEFEQLWTLFLVNKFSLGMHYETLASKINENAFPYFMYRKRYNDLIDYLEYVLKIKIEWNDIQEIYIPQIESANVELLFTFTEVIVALFDWRNYNQLGYLYPTDLQDPISQISSNIANFLEVSNHELVEGEHGKIIISKSASTTQAAEIVSDKSVNTSHLILEYKHFSNYGNLSEKKRILVELGHYFENELKEEAKIKKSVADDINFLLNNFQLRHNNSEETQANIVINDISAEELEAVYDMTYSLFLSFIIGEDQKEVHEKIDGYKKK